MISLTRGAASDAVVTQILIVNKATPILAWNKPADILFGTRLSSVQLNASATVAGQTVSGQYSYFPPAGTVLPAGNNQILGVFFAPDDLATIDFASGSTSINVRITGTAGVRGDIDGDGKPDLLFQNSNGALAAWLMDGANMSSAGFLTPDNVGDTNWQVAGSADFNGDEEEDLLFQHKDGTVAVWFLNGITLLRASLLSPSNPGTVWRVVSTVDRNADGKPDVLFQHDDGTLAVWFMDGIRLKDAKILDPANPGGAWKVVAP